MVPAETSTVSGVPSGNPPLRIVKVTVPLPTVPAGLVIVVLRGTPCSPSLKGVEALAAAIAVVAAVTVRLWPESEEPAKSGVPL